MTLNELAVKHGTDKSSEAHDYCHAYANHFPRAHIEALLEVGIHVGHSLEMWHEWVPEALVIGLDVKPEAIVGLRGPLEHGGEFIRDFSINILPVLCDAKVYEPPVDLDVIIDDGSHMSSDMSATFFNLWPRLRPGGHYAIEDWQFQWEWGQDDHSAFDLADERFRSLLSGRDREIKDVIELHAYPELLILRKAL